MQCSKRSYDEISFELTQQNIDIQSKSAIPSSHGLVYSNSSLSISNHLEKITPLSIHINHCQDKQTDCISQLRFKERDNHFLQFSTDYNCSKDHLTEKLQLLNRYFHRPRNERFRQSGKLRLVQNQSKGKKSKSQSISQQTQEKPRNSRSSTIRHCLFICHSKQNQQNVERTKSKSNQKKTKPRQNKKYLQQQIRKSKKIGLQGESEGANSILTKVFMTKRLQLSHNQFQQKKYLQKMILSRQNILHSSSKHSVFPVI